MIFWNPTTNPIISFVNATIKEIYYWCLLILIQPTAAHTSLEFWYMCVCLQHTLPYGQRTISYPTTIHIIETTRIYSRYGFCGQNFQGSLSPFELLIIFPLNATM
jgi:hypothetical protein